MILLIITIVCLVGSVAATDTATNDTTTIQQDISVNEVSDTSISSTSNGISSTENSVSTTSNSKTSSDTSNHTIKSIQSTSTSKSTTETTDIITSNTTKNKPTETTNTKKSIKSSTSSSQKHATTTSVKTIKEYAGTKTSIKAIIKTTDGSNVKNGDVAFKINGKTIGKGKVTNGVATLQYTIPSSWKDTSYTIKVVYGGNNLYKTSEATGKLYLKNTMKTSVKIYTNTTAFGKATRISTIILAKDGSSIKGGNVAFKINGKTIGHSKVSNGKASITYNIPSSWSAKIYKVTVTYSGHDLYKSSTGTGNLKICGYTTVTVTDITSKQGSTVTLKAAIKTTDGSSVKDGNVAFKINGKTIGHGKVTNGVATLQYTIPSSWKDNSYTIKIVYGGNSKYYGATGTGELSLNTVPSRYASYLTQTKNCQVNSATIQRLARWYNTTYSNTYYKARAIFNNLNARISYSYYYNTKNGAVKTYTKRYGNCVDMSHLLIAVSRAAGIPARYCHSTCTFRSGLVVGHVWSELYVNGKWYKCDLTSSSNSFGNIVNWKRCTTVHRYRELPF